ncbi:MAG TPA: hypothetical protein VNH18_35460, partial [Bryobacteraceae bacterium]|nr:hypothetical protein [Bryobacteraceae bacterium]
QDIVPMGQMLQGQGMTIDLVAYLEKVQAYANLPELSEILKKTTLPPDPEEQAVNDPPGKPATTTRTYDSRSTKSGPGDGSAELIGNMSKGTSPTGVR